jgi:hypothetical protein
MIIYLASILVAAAITFISIMDEYDKSFKKCVLYSRVSLAITFFVGIVMHIVLVSSSYNTYVDARAKYDAIITQYRQAVTMYGDRASIDINRATFTDFAYQGYQENIGKMIIDLREEVTKYNKTIISKRTYKKNIFFRALIVPPDDDMKIINLTGEIKGDKKDDPIVNSTGTPTENKKPGV